MAQPKSPTESSTPKENALRSVWAIEECKVTLQRTKDISPSIRSLVSKKKIRYQDGKYDLDLAYITDRIIAMGFPSEALEGVYRNPMKQVQKFLKERHKNHFKVYNLCSERDYEDKKFGGRVARYPFDDHNCPPIEMIVKFSEDLTTWLNESEENVGVIHCKAGKGRTGLMICAFLLFRYHYSGATSQDILDFYAERRTRNSKGVTIPSQRRFVCYFERVLVDTLPLKELSSSYLVLSSITLINAPGGVDPTFVMKANNETIFNGDTIANKTRKGTKFDIQYKPNKIVNGEIKVQFYDRDDCLFYFWFHVYFIQNNKLVLIREELDGIKKSRHHFTGDFSVELEFEAVLVGLSRSATGPAPLPGSGLFSHTGKEGLIDLLGLDKEEGVSFLNELTVNSFSSPNLTDNYTPPVEALSEEPSPPLPPPPPPPPSGTKKYSRENKDTNISEEEGLQTSSSRPVMSGGGIPCMLPIQEIKLRSIKKKDINPGYAIGANTTSSSNGEIGAIDESANSLPPSPPPAGNRGGININGTLPFKQEPQQKAVDNEISSSSSSKASQRGSINGSRTPSPPTSLSPLSVRKGGSKTIVPPPRPLVPERDSSSPSQPQLQLQPPPPPPPPPPLRSPCSSPVSETPQTHSTRPTSPSPAQYKTPPPRPSPPPKPLPKTALQTDQHIHNNNNNNNNSNNNNNNHNDSNHSEERHTALNLSRSHNITPSTSGNSSPSNLSPSVSVDEMKTTSFTQSFHRATTLKQDSNVYKIRQQLLLSGLNNLASSSSSTHSASPTRPGKPPRSFSKNPPR